MDIHDEIAKYYPIGTWEFDPGYFSHSAYSNLAELRKKKSGDSYTAKWKKLQREIEGNTKVLSAETISHEDHPCFSLSVLLHSEKSDTITYTREMQIHISLVAPVYSIFGVDWVTINQIEKTLNPLIYVSPISIFESWFPLLKTLVERIYDGHKFIAFSDLEVRIEDLTVPGAFNEFEQDSSVFQALFTSENITNYPTIGDFLYE